MIMYSIEYFASRSRATMMGVTCSWWELTLRRYWTRCVISLRWTWCTYGHVFTLLGWKFIVLLIFFFFFLRRSWQTQSRLRQIRTTLRPHYWPLSTAPPLLLLHAGHPPPQGWQRSQLPRRQPCLLFARQSRTRHSCCRWHIYAHCPHYAHNQNCTRFKKRTVSSCTCTLINEILSSNPPTSLFCRQDARGRLLSAQSSIQQLRKQLAEADSARREADQRHLTLQRERDAAQRDKETTQREKDRLRLERDTLARFRICNELVSIMC